MARHAGTRKVVPAQEKDEMRPHTKHAALYLSFTHLFRRWR